MIITVRNNNQFLRNVCEPITFQIITSTDGVVFISFSLLISRNNAKTTHPVFTKFGVKVVHGPRKKPLDYAGNPDHVILGYS